jgi:hypothetical protein
VNEGGTKIVVTLTRCRRGTDGVMKGRVHESHDRSS